MAIDRLGGEISADEGGVLLGVVRSKGHKDLPVKAAVDGSPVEVSSPPSLAYALEVGHVDIVRAFLGAVKTEHPDFEARRPEDIIEDWRAARAIAAN